MPCDVIKTAFVIYRLKWKFSILKHLDDIQSSTKFTHHRLIWKPNTIQQDIHPNIWLAGNSPAGHSAGTIFLPIIQKWGIMVKISHIWQKIYQSGFRLFKVSESWKFQMSSFVVQTGHFLSHSKENEKMSNIWHNDTPKAFKISNQFPFIQSQWAMKIPNVFILRQYR